MSLNHVLLLALLSAATPALAQATDHLTPPPDALLQPNGLTAYRADVGRRLGRALARSPLAQVVVYPSFEPEYLLSIEQTGAEAYTLTHRRAQRSIRQALPLKLPANVTLLTQHGTQVAPPRSAAAPDSISLTTYQVPLQPQLAQALTDLFNVALVQARYPSKSGFFIDGTRLTFIARNAQGDYRSGDVQSPAQGKQMQQLVKIVDGLRELATNSSDREFAQGVLLHDIQTLLLELAAR